MRPTNGPFDDLPSALRALRVGPAAQGRAAIAAWIELLALDPREARRLERRLARSMSPKISVVHQLLSYLFAADGGPVSEIVPVRTYDPERQAEPARQLLSELGFGLWLLPELFQQAELTRYARSLSAGGGVSGARAFGPRLLLRFDQGSAPTATALEQLLADTQSLVLDEVTAAARLRLESIASDMRMLTRLAKREIPIDVDELPPLLDSALWLVSRGWSLKTPTISSGLERTESPAWFSINAILDLARHLGRDGAERVAKALKRARRAGETVRLADQLGLDHLDPAPVFGTPIDPRRHPLLYAVTAAGYWWLMGQEEHEQVHRAQARVLLAELDLPESLLPLTCFSSFEALAEGQAVPGDPREERVYWWMGLEKAHVTLAEDQLPAHCTATLSRAATPELRVLHAGAADGSQSYYWAAALRHALDQLGRREVLAAVDAFDLGGAPPITGDRLELSQVHPAYASAWPLLGEELCGEEGDGPSVARRLRQIGSASGVLATTAESLPFALDGTGRGPHYQILPSAERRARVRFFQDDLFAPKNIPERGYQVLLISCVLPWLSIYDGDPTMYDGGEPLRRAMLALRPYLADGALLVLDALSLLDRDNREWELIEDEEGVTSYDYKNRQLVALEPLDGLHVIVLEPKGGALSLEKFVERFRAQGQGP